MAVSHDTEYRQMGSFWTSLLAQLTWYDLVLAAIPLAFVIPLLGLVVFSVPFHVALAGGAVTGVLLVADVLFVHAPTPESS